MRKKHFWNLVKWQVLYISKNIWKWKKIFVVLDTSYGQEVVSYF